MAAAAPAGTKTKRAGKEGRKKKQTSIDTVWDATLDQINRKCPRGGVINKGKGECGVGR